MAGVTAQDIAQVSFGYGLFTGDFGLHQGLECVGAAMKLVIMSIMRIIK